MKLRADHPSTLTFMNILAFTWKGQAKYAQALTLMEDCLHRRKHALGVQHLEFLSSQAALIQWQAEQSDVSN